jgi:hypothetical protein
MELLTAYLTRSNPMEHPRKEMACPHAQKVANLTSKLAAHLAVLHQVIRIFPPKTRSTAFLRLINH